MILVTGAAGFIGHATCKKLLEKGHCVFGIDNLNTYYDVNLKKARLRNLEFFPNFHFHERDLTDQDFFEGIFQRHAFQTIIHLAAQAGVRYSLQDPFAYVRSNLVGFATLLECARSLEHLRHFVYASTSSVYGQNTCLPFHEELKTNTPMSLYSATKQANESMAQAYFHLYHLPVTGLRFFTVYGPFGRPDMSLFKFTKSILEHQPIEIYNNGNMVRDWTYIDDVVDGILSVLSHPHLAKEGAHPLYNIGCGHPESLQNAICYLEEVLHSEAQKIYLPLQKGDVLETKADITKAQKELGYAPKILLKEGISRFVAWYKDFYGEDIPF